MKTRIAVISDIHANADALSVALSEIKSKAVDILIVLGDILTYGCQPIEVINLLKKYNKINKVVFIKGNHDQMYFDHSSINNQTYNPPKFVQESLSWTMKTIRNIQLNEIFSWQNNYFYGDVFFAHANPFKYGDWSYIEDDQKLQKSFQILSKNDFFAGVFGHSHRQIFICKKDDVMVEMEKFSSYDNIDQLIINTGSVGQPRGRGLGYVVLDFDNKKLVKAGFKSLKIDFINSINLIKKVKFSADTEAKLLNYFNG